MLEKTGTWHRQFNVGGKIETGHKNITIGRDVGTNINLVGIK